jgi:fructose-1,6-bisphosphatase/inositol monophosphatase family enzyme
MNIDQAIALLKAEGFRVSKPRAKAPQKPLLNAVGKPLSPLYDPNYRIKHKTSRSHLFTPYGRHMRWVGYAVLALALLASGHADAAEYPLQCGRVEYCAKDGIMTKEGKFVLVTVNPSRFGFTYACWRTFDTLSEARAALASQTKR